jgi:two-component system cell cycle response regulator DivK
VTTILLVEDDAMNRDMIARQLEWEGYEVIMAGDGLQAIAIARSARPQLILMDMGLPVLNGWESTARIKADPETRAIPVIALTAFAMAEDRARSLAAGCDAFETKPIDFRRLMALIRQLIAAASDAGA